MDDRKSVSKLRVFRFTIKRMSSKKRHNIKIDEHILRLELRFGRSKITKMTKAKDWYGQLIELSKQVEKQQSKFLHRLHMTYFDPVPLSELLDRIDASKYHQKDKEEMRRIAQKGERLRFARSRP